MAPIKIVKPYEKWVKQRYNKIMLETKVTTVEAKEGIHVTMEDKKGQTVIEKYDGVVAVGRRQMGY